MITEFKLFENKKDIPNWFYLVLRIKNYDYSGFSELSKDMLLHSLMKMELVDLKGISDNSEISNHFFDMRDLLLIMKGSDVIKMNNIEEIEYYNPDSFCKNNFVNWRRITMNLPHFTNFHSSKWKEDISFRGAISQIFKDLHYDKLTPNKSGGFKTNIHFDKNGVIKIIQSSQYKLTDMFDSLYQTNQLHINSLDDFTKKTLEILKDYISTHPISTDYPWDKNYWFPIENYILNDLKFNELKKILSRSFKYISQIYEHEGEWSINSKSFKVPKNSILYFKEYVDGESNGVSKGLSKELIDEIVKMFGLNHIYQIKTVSNHIDMTNILKNEYSNK